MPIYEVMIDCTISKECKFEDLHKKDRAVEPWKSVKYEVNANTKEDACERGEIIFRTRYPLSRPENFTIASWAFELQRDLTVHNVDKFIEALQFAIDTGDQAGFVKSLAASISQRGAMDMVDMYPDLNGDNKSFQINHHSSVQKSRVTSEAYELKNRVTMGEITGAQALEQEEQVKYYIMGLELTGYGKELSVSLCGSPDGKPRYTINT